MPKKILFVCLIIVGVMMVMLLAVCYVVLTGKKPAPSPASLEEQITQTISDYDFSEREFDTVDTIKAAGADAVPILEKLIVNDDQKTRYLAYVAISGLAKEQPALKDQLLPMLKKGLTDSDNSIKAQTAQLLLTFQDPAPLKTLIDLINSTETMVPSEPPMAIGEFSYLILLDSTKLDLKKDKQTWSSWWDKNNETLIWNNEEQKFFAPVQ